MAVSGLVRSVGFVLAALIMGSPASVRAVPADVPAAVIVAPLEGPGASRSAAPSEPAVRAQAVSPPAVSPPAERPPADGDDSVGADDTARADRADGEDRRDAAKGPETTVPAQPKKSWKRDGINPCMTPDPGFGIYAPWSRNVSMGQLLAPERGGLTKSGGFDLIVHFHGHYPIRKEFVKVAKGLVLVAIDLGVSSGPYASAFASPRAFEKLLESVKAEMAKKSGRTKVFIRRLALSSWSAGYGATAQILQQPAGKTVDAVILLDSLYGSYVEPSQKTIAPASLAPFIAFAEQAAKGKRLMYQSHSSIIPPGYASTREVSEFVVGKLGGALRSATRKDVLGLEMFERFERGNYYVRGYRGDDKPDHCAHLGLMREVIRTHLGPRWQTPRGSGSGKLVLAKAEKDELGDGAEKKAEKKLVAPPGGHIHVVVEGQSLGRIARRYQVSVDAIRAATGLDGASRIKPGQKLVIPPNEKASRTKKKAKPSATKAGATKPSATKLAATKLTAR
ncbi:MAG: LysM peptidoglycan-binding domain-containing protein [Myxococcales bacterium]|nr:LysM peptidoglycan-binding domain-containing protein [Myxococcales bacterium]